MPKPKPQYLENGDPELMDPNELEMASGQNTQDPRLAFDPHVYQDPDGSISNSLDDWMVAQNLAKRGAGLNYGPKTPTPSPASVAAQPKGYEPPPQMTKWSQALTGRLDDQGQPVPYDPKDITTGPPQMKEPKWWQRALAVGAGGAAGFANAMGKRAPAIDVGSMGENILHPGYGEQMAEWKQRVAPLQAAAQIAQNQQQAALQQGIGQSTIERNKAQGQYYSGQGRGSMLVTQAISDASGGELPVGTMQPYQGVVQVLSQNKGTVVIDADTAAMTGLKEGSRQPTSIVSTQLKARSGMVQITDPETATALKKPVGDWVSASTYKLAFPASGKQDPNDWINIANDETKPADVRARAQKNYDTYMKGQMRLHPTNVNNITMPGMPAPQPTGVTAYDQVLSKYPQQVRAAAQSLLDYSLPVSPRNTNSPLIQGATQAAREAAKANGEDWDFKNYATRQRLMQDVTSGKTSYEVRAINTVIGHFGVLYDAANALQNGDVNALNRIANWSGVQIGRDPVTTFQTIVHRVGPETVQAYLGSGGEAQDRKQAEEDFSPNRGPQQLVSNIRTSAGLLRTKVGAVESMWKGTFQNSKPFPYEGGHVVGPAAQTALDHIMGVQGGGQQGGKISVTAPDGSVHPFDTLEQANMFKKLAGIK